jgi:hypothetical protein
LGYCSRLFVQEIPAERSQVTLGLGIVVTKDHGRQYDHRRSARKLFLFLHYERSPHIVDTSSFLQSLKLQLRRE